MSDPSSTTGEASIGPESASAEPEGSPPYRVGRRLGRTIYLLDECVGMVDTPEIARVLVDSANVCWSAGFRLGVKCPWRELLTELVAECIGDARDETCIACGTRHDTDHVEHDGDPSCVVSRVLQAERSATSDDSVALHDLAPSTAPSANPSPEAHAHALDLMPNEASEYISTRGPKVTIEEMRRVGPDPDEETVTGYRVSAIGPKRSTREEAERDVAAYRVLAEPVQGPPVADWSRQRRGGVCEACGERAFYLLSMDPGGTRWCCCDHCAAFLRGESPTHRGTTPRPETPRLPSEKQIKAWLEGASRTMTGRIATSALAILDAIDWTPDEKPVECICARDSHLAGLPVARVPQCPAHRSALEKEGHTDR